VLDAPETSSWRAAYDSARPLNKTSERVPYNALSQRAAPRDAC
jgi:hypothetical protein